VKVSSAAVIEALPTLLAEAPELEWRYRSSKTTGLRESGADTQFLGRSVGRDSESSQPYLAST
jgi:hypothetical protein